VGGAAAGRLGLRHGRVGSRLDDPRVSRRGGRGSARQSGFRERPVRFHPVSGYFKI
jgi:hypothetical protein